MLHATLRVKKSEIFIERSELLWFQPVTSILGCSYRLMYNLISKRFITVLPKSFTRVKTKSSSLKDCVS